MWLTLALACASLMGLEELDQVPADFPLTLAGEIGHVTTPASGGAISVDLAFETREEADRALAGLRAQAEAAGYRSVERRAEKKRDTERFDGDGGRIELGCCPQRADRWWLILVTFWPPPAAAPR